MKMARPPSSGFWVAVGLLVLVSCIGDDSVALEVDCADTFHNRQTNVACYIVSVPADHSEPVGDSMDLFVVVVDNQGGEEIGPVALLVGGPGQAAHLFDRDMRGSPFDVVLVDQRGTGLSEPSLDCPELDEIPLSIGFTANGPDLYADALADCEARLSSAGVDVSLFDTESNARDFDVVRTALGYDEWNLWGSSYGTRLGLEILRLHPETVRAAVFGSVDAPQADLMAEWPDHHRSAVDLLTESCAASTDCNDAYGDIGLVLNELVEELDAVPVDVEFRGEIVRMDGATLARTVLEALSSTELIAELPYLLSAAAEGNLIPFAEFRVANDDPTFSDGMFWSVQCRDNFSVTDQDAMTAALADEAGGFYQAFDYTWNIETCRQWGAGTSRSSTHEPVISDVPTLLLAGRFDWATPPVWAQEVAQGLTNSTYIEFARHSHDVPFSFCGLAVSEIFLLDPTQPPEIPCDPTEPPRWRLP